ncbi:6728_t:CDS:10, partial [Acaulospora colombiana]
MESFGSLEAIALAYSYNDWIYVMAGEHGHYNLLPTAFEGFSQPLEDLFTEHYFEYECLRQTYILEDFLGDWTKHDGYWKYNKSIEKPLLDDRSYELIRLDNDLQVLLVSDPSADLAGVSLDVGGTEDFPVENEYKKYIKKHGGMTNASTSSSTTTYHFQVQSPFLSGAVHRFAGFFHSPLFASSCVAREQMDNRRIYQLWKSLSDTNHAWNKFGCGSKSTLMENDSTDGEAQTRARVVEWWKNNYCSSRMKVAIIGAGEPIKPRPIALDEGTPLGCDCSTSKNHTEVRSRTHNVIENSLCGDSPGYPAGPGSAFYLLHQRGLATSLSCGLHAAGRGFSLLHIDITLTKAGLGVQFVNYLPHHFEEIQRMSEINFLYTSKYNPDAYAKMLSQVMNDDIGREHILSGGVFDWKFDPLNIEHLISCLTPQQSRIFVAAKNFNVLQLSGSWEKERWYGTKFLQQEFSPATLKKLSSEEVSALYLPGKNEFLPSSLDVDKIPVESPPKLLNPPNGTSYGTRKMINFGSHEAQSLSNFRGSTCLSVCRIDLLTLFSPLMTGNLSPIRIYVGMVLDALQGPAYMTTLAGIFFDIYVDVDGIVVEVVGYNDKLRKALDMILLHLVNLEIGRVYDNVYMRQSGEVTDIFLSQARSEKLMTAPDKRKELNENSAISFYCHVGDVADLRTRALNSLLSSMINEPFFNVIRTQEQLGYSVSCISWASTSSLGLRFRVQSTRHPKFLEYRIEEFINTYRETLRSMSPEEYREHRNGVVEKKRKKLVNLGEERARYWGHIDNEYLDFARAENEGQEVETLELQDLIDFYERFVHSSSPFRSKLSVRLTSQQITKGDDESNGYLTEGNRQPEIFEDIQRLRERMTVS